MYQKDIALCIMGIAHKGDQRAVSRNGRFPQFSLRAGQLLGRASSGLISRSQPQLRKPLFLRDEHQPAVVFRCRGVQNRIGSEGDLDGFVDGKLLRAFSTGRAVDRRLGLRC